MLLVAFRPTGGDPVFARLARDVFADPLVQRRLASRYVCVCLDEDVRVRVDGQRVALLSHPAFAALNESSGIAVLDFAHPQAEYFGSVVSAISFAADKTLSAAELCEFLDLPAGTPDQRAALFVQRVARAKRWPPIAWHEDYGQAMAEAQREGRFLAVLFCASGDVMSCAALADDVLDDPVVRDRLSECVAVRLPVDAQIRIGGKRVRLIDEPAFAEMQGQQGLALLDFAHSDAEYYGTVVNTFPMLYGRPYSVEQVRVMLDLPPGTLTQRTLIYAVRTHPEQPASAAGVLLEGLAREACSHSEYQARIRLQGHHHWSMRFHRIRALLPGGGNAFEVCAESWPGEGLLAAAIECVRCWRLSSGHWGKVRSPHAFFAYDMKRGSNGVWYATGIFGER